MAPRFGGRKLRSEVLQALQALGGSASIATLARRLDLDRVRVQATLHNLGTDGQVEADGLPGGRGALAEPGERFERLWRLKSGGSR